MTGRVRRDSDLVRRHDTMRGPCSFSGTASSLLPGCDYYRSDYYVHAERGERMGRIDGLSGSPESLHVSVRAWTTRRDSAWLRFAQLGHAGHGRRASQFKNGRIHRSRQMTLRLNVLEPSLGQFPDRLPFQPRPAKFNARRCVSNAAFGIRAASTPLREFAGRSLLPQVAAGCIEDVDAESGFGMIDGQRSLCVTLDPIIGI